MPGSRHRGAEGPYSGNLDRIQIVKGWTNTLGAAQMITTWKAPEFDPGQRTFYCACVIEIPTPRWTAYDVKRSGLEVGPEVPMTLQERAYTSPLWYTPYVQGGAARA